MIKFMQMMLLTSSVLLFLVLAASGRAGGEVVIVANPGISVSSLSEQDVKQIFLGKIKSVGGESVKIIVQKDGDVHRKFLDDYVSRTPSQYKRYYKKLVFTGKGRAPIKVADDQAMLAYISRTTGAIGYVNAGAVNDKVKIIAVTN
jgi:ABC-type phosphate transport system substrate-binding protein